MITLTRISDAVHWRTQARHPIVFVPTMGALHEGHVALIRAARRIAGNQGVIVVSIFVNPTQFGPNEDFATYPRSFVEDCALCLKEGVDLLFHPPQEEMYPLDASVSIQERSLSLAFCGISRPGFFNGVCTIVSMLFNIISPDIAIFGEKDWQQVAVIQKMVRDLKMPIKIATHPTIRDKDGLALSSRNSMLTASSRHVAPQIHQALQAVAMQSKEGERSVLRLCAQLKKNLEAIPDLLVDYVAIVDQSTLLPLQTLNASTKSRALVAVYLGSIRLIDNLAICVDE